jgi:hypothetical protein
MSTGTEIILLCIALLGLCYLGRLSNNGERKYKKTQLYKDRQKVKEEQAMIRLWSRRNSHRSRRTMGIVLY